MDAALASHVAHLTHRPAAAAGDAGDDSSPLHLASFVDVVDPAAVLGMGRKKFAELDANGNQNPKPIPNWKEKVRRAGRQREPRAGWRGA